MDTILEAKNLAQSLMARMAWEQQCKPLLKMSEIKTGLGTEKTLNKLFTSFDSEDYARKFIEFYKPYYKQALLAGNRTIKIYQLDKDEFEKVLAAYKNVAVTKNIDTKFFPYYIDEDNIAKLSKETKLTHVTEVYEKTYFYFSTNRSITEKLDLTPSVFQDNAEIVKFLGKYSKVTAFTDKSRQYIDIICLNSADNTIEIRLDTSSAVAMKDINLLFREVQEAFVELMPERLDFLIFNKSINFFPWIDGLCNDKDCRVVELSFTTDDGYIHHERDRNASKGGDVRVGEFHQGGIERCEINPYRISARWASQFTPELEYEYEMSLNSSVRELSKAGAGLLNFAIISMCPNEKDLDSLLAILKNTHELSKIN
ncbi:hypothetical protein GNP84_16355 [Aliivibrio fischeri]|uniref:hypothetical protein n=1 Tax=Aliivibrio fischeri TaxID=668 RepID=UPI0012D91856|nr:hypothetical protein [Aliivibrio fischeri]MUK78456.1 hypothetical protein [Aliivibrio fischeri]